MNQVEQIRIQLPQSFAPQRQYISDRVRDGIQQRQWQGESHIEQLQLGMIATTEHTSADDLVAEILRRIDDQMEPYQL